MVAISGMEIWKSESSSSRKASNSSSERSISSIRSTGGVASSLSMASSSGRRSRNSELKISRSAARRSSPSHQPDVEKLAGIVPLVDGMRQVDALVALEAGQPRAKDLGHDLGR